MEEHTPDALCNARQLRKEMTLPEVLLWNRLRGKPMGVKFRKQHPMGEFVLDFYCAAERVAIEIDGIAHDMGNRPAEDIRRDTWLGKQGVEVLRIPAKDLLLDVDEVAEAIVKFCANRPPPSALRAATSPSGGGI